MIGPIDVRRVEVGLHQGSALSPYMFLLQMDVLTEYVRKDIMPTWINDVRR